MAIENDQILLLQGPMLKHRQTREAQVVERAFRAALLGTLSETGLRNPS